MIFQDRERIYLNSTINPDNESASSDSLIKDDLVISQDVNYQQNKNYQNEDPKNSNQTNDIDLLAKLEAANKALENDSKSLLGLSLSSTNSTVALGSGSRTSSQNSLASSAHTKTIGDIKPSKMIPAAINQNNNNGASLQQKLSSIFFPFTAKTSQSNGSIEESEISSCNTDMNSVTSETITQHQGQGLTNNDLSILDGFDDYNPHLNECSTNLVKYPIIASHAEEPHGDNTTIISPLHYDNMNEKSIPQNSSLLSTISLVNATPPETVKGLDDEVIWSLWSELIRDWENAKSSYTPLIRELVLRGIPQPFRPMAWQLLSGNHMLLVPNTAALEESVVKPVYANFLKLTSPYEKLIKRDINRTYPDHKFFKETNSAGQESLFNVMKAYSLCDTEVGYCQGSCFIVGLLLMQMPEENAFSVLLNIMTGQKHNLRRLFKPCMSDLATCMYQLECLIQDYLPDLAIHFQEHAFHASLYASPWFLTLFSSTLPLETAFRIMDVFLLEGLDVIFKIAAAILSLSKMDLMALDMEGMIQYLQKDIPARLGNDPDVLFHIAFYGNGGAGVPLDTKRMKRLEKDYTTIRAKENEGLAETKKLKGENRLLKQRIQYLEQESASLADRLVQGQVSRALAAEESYSVKRDFRVLRQVLDDKDQNLAVALEQIRHLKLKEGCELSWEDEKQRNIEIIETLEQELLAVKYREAECLASFHELKREHDILEKNYRMITLTHKQELQNMTRELEFLRLKDVEWQETQAAIEGQIRRLALQWKLYITWVRSNYQKIFSTPDTFLPTALKTKSSSNDHLSLDAKNNYTVSHGDNDNLAFFNPENVMDDNKDRTIMSYIPIPEFDDTIVNTILMFNPGGSGGGDGAFQSKISVNDNDDSYNVIHSNANTKININNNQVPSNSPIESNESKNGSRVMPEKNGLIKKITVIDNDMNESNGINHTPSLNVSTLTQLHESMCRKDRKLVRELLDYVMASSFRELTHNAHMAKLQTTLIDLQTQLNAKVRICNELQNNIEFCHEKFDEYVNLDAQSQHRIKTLEWEISDLKTQIDEKNLTIKLRETELMENIADLSTNTSRLETEKQLSILNDSLTPHDPSNTIENTNSLGDISLQNTQASLSLSNLALHNLNPVKLPELDMYDVDHGTSRNGSCSSIDSNLSLILNGIPSTNNPPHKNLKN